MLSKKEREILHTTLDFLIDNKEARKRFLVPILKQYSKYLDWNEWESYGEIQFKDQEIIRKLEK